MQNAQTQPHTRRSEFFDGVVATIPLVVGAIPFGLIYGALAVSSGLSPAASIAMSTFVFAGSAQFIATGLIANGVAPLVIVLTTFIVNLRHSLYAATLAPHMKHLPQRWLIPFGFWLTDEAFVATITRYNQEDNSPHKHWFYFGSALFMYINWQVVTIIGVIAGQAIPGAANWGLDFAMVVTFIGMLVPLVENWATVAAVVVAGATALLANNLPHKLGLMLAALLGILAGVLVDLLSPKTEEVTNDL
ncbi:MAG: AzlC family ABC transporter permease [Anaerolineales bacterium]|nr:AzlC family ABC transporter permease [Anaerolineales bacterium]